MTHHDNEKKDDYRELLGEEPEACAACGGPLDLEKVNLEDYQGGKLFMMESVPAYVCQECGEIWVPEPIMEEFEKMIETVKNRPAVKSQPQKKKIKGKTKTIERKE